MHNEGMQILKMLEEGKITAEEAARLLDTLSEPPETGTSKKAKRLRVEITDPETNKKKVNLRIPLGLAKIATKFIPAKKKQELAEQGVDIDEVLSQVTSENVGKIIDIESDEGLVQISIE